MPKKIPLLVILGPTGSGKSSLAVDLALKFGGELISADSRQVYKGMDIATAKLRYPELPRGVRQHLIDVLDPDQAFTLKNYQRRANRAIKDIARRGRLPILVGGTGLYIDAVVEGWDLPKAAPKRLRGHLLKRLEIEGLESLVKELRRLDKPTAQTIDLKNARRVIRALEYVLSSGESFTKAKQKKNTNYEVLKIGLYPGKKKLEKRIAQRVHKMFNQGLLAETKRLLKKYPTTLSSMSAIEYRIIARHLHHELSEHEAKEMIIRDDLKYVKRQFTWFKRDEKIVWCSTASEAKRAVKEWLTIRP